MEAILLYIDNWCSSRKIEMMDAAEERGYLRLLMRAAKEPDCGLPDDDAQLAVISKLAAQWKRPTREPEFRVRNEACATKTSGEKLRECFFSRGGRIYNERLLREHAKYLLKLEQKRSAAKKRWRKQDAAEHADAMRAHMRTDMQPESGWICGDLCGDDAATIQTYKHTNKNTPLPPLSEGAGANAPLELTPSDASRKPSVKRKPYEDALQQIARAIHVRHPNSAGAAGRRDLSISGVEKALSAILKHKRVLADDCEACLRQIDRNHVACCESEAWRKDTGQFVKSLRGWLAPREERYEIAPDVAARIEPVRLLA